MHQLKVPQVARENAVGLPLLACAFLLGCHSPNRAASEDTATFDPDGTAHITRVVAMPSTVGRETQWLASLTQKKSGTQTLAERRAATDERRKQDSAEARKVYPVNVEETNLAGVRADIITPLSMREVNRDRVLINLHGGGFNSDSGSLIEGVPISNLAKVKVVSVYYRLAPENPFPAAVDDVVAVYKELLKTYKPHGIGIFDTSAGATLTSEVAVRLKQSGLPLPQPWGCFQSTRTSAGRPIPSSSLLSKDFPADLQPQDPNRAPDDQYAGDNKDPVLSPLFTDLKGLPPSLLLTSTRNLLLSDTAMFHLALLRAGDDAQLLVFEAWPHAFWYHFELPETREALERIARFFEEKVER